MNNRDNETEVYHEDNSFNNQGIEPAQSDEMRDEQVQIPNQKRGRVLNNTKDLAHGFKDGVHNDLNSNKNDPALGVNKQGKKSSNNDNKNKNNNNNKKNPAKGQNNAKNKKNPLPGGGFWNKDKNRNENNNKEQNNSGKKPDDKNSKSGNNKNGGILSKVNPMVRKASKQSNNRSSILNKSDKSPNLNNAEKSIIQRAWLAAPIHVKVVVLGLSIIPIILIALIAFVGIFGGTTAAITASMCEEDGVGSSYNGEGYTGSGEVKDFLCKMQSPFVGNYEITSYAGYRIHPIYGYRKYHEGMDFGIPTGTTIYAAQAGTVIHAGLEGGYGYSVVIEHGSGFTTRYAHNSKLLVKEGDKVGKGQKVALSGNTGNSTGPHLHFEVRTNGKVVEEPLNNRLEKPSEYKKNCGSKWDGELTGDSANAKNDTTDYVYTGSSSSDEECCVTEGSSSSEYCPNGITVTGENAGTYDLEEYVAGVVSGESYEGQNIEAYKAQAIAARTYAISRTNNCSNSIGNSQNAQVFSDKLKEGAEEAVKATSGQVLLDDGEVFSSEYDSFCYNDSDCTYGTEDGKRYVVYTKVPSDETHKVYLSSSYYSMINGGHGRGMSQVVAYEMADQGKKYDEILKFFYADNIEITGSSGNVCEVAGNSFNGKIYQYYQTDYDVKFCGEQTIYESGCVPTSMAVVVSSLLGEEHPPAELAEFGCDGGHCSKTRNSGCSASLFKAAASEYGIKYSTISISDKDEILAKLNGGNTIFIALIKKGLTPFANTADHAIVIYGADSDGNVSIWDPYESHNVNNKTWDFEEYFNKETVSGMYMFSKK